MVDCRIMGYSCSACYSPINLVVQPPPKHPLYHWAVYCLCSNAQCPNPATYICDGSCQSKRNCVFTNTRQLHDHHRAKHNSNDNKRSRFSHLAVSTISAHQFHMPIAFDRKPKPLIEVKKPPSSMRFLFNNKAIDQFSDKIVHFGMTHAIGYLIKRAGYQISNEYELKVFSSLVNGCNMLVFLNISLLIQKCGTKNLSYLENVLFPLVDQLKSGLASWVPIPVSVASFSQMVTNLSNKNSLFSLLPTIVPKLFPNENACVSVVGLLAMQMLIPRHKMETVRQEKVKSFASLPWFRDLGQSTSRREPGCLHWKAFVIIWSDGWDPFLSTKGNRRPVWSLTTTMILADTKVWKPRMCFTDLCAMGPGKTNHSEVIDCIVKDLRKQQEITQYFYHSASSLYIGVTFQVGLILQDQPERRSMFGLQYGNSKFHSVFGLSCDFSRLDRPFNSCLACARQVDEYISSRTWDRPIYHNVTTPCLSCYGWSLEIVTWRVRRS